MKHQLDATLCTFYFCRVTLHVSGASAHHQEYLKLVRRPLVHVLSLQVSHHISLLGPLKATICHDSQGFTSDGPRSFNIQGNISSCITNIISSALLIFHHLFNADSPYILPNQLYEYHNIVSNYCGSHCQYDHKGDQGRDGKMT